MEAPHVKKEIKKGFWARLRSKLKFGFLLVLLLPSLSYARPHHGRVRRVLSGDQIQLENGTVVRYLGIEAPLLGSPHYAEAVSSNRAWVEKKGSAITVWPSRTGSQRGLDGLCFCGRRFL